MIQSFLCEDGRGRLVPAPGHASDTTDIGVREGVERGRGEVEVGQGTCFTTVGNSDGDALALV